MPNIITQNISVDIKPLWTQDTDLNEIGITRRDIFIRENIKPYFTIFGSTIMMGKDNYWGDRVGFRFHYGLRRICRGKGWGTLENRTPNQNDPVLVLDFNAEVRKLRFGIYIGIRIPIPFFKIKIRNEYCDLDGDKFDLNVYDIINHGDTNQCSVDSALDTIPSNGITNKLFVDTHRDTNLKINVFSISPDLDENTVEQFRLGNTSFTDNLNIDDDITLLKENKDYLVLDESGRFIVMGLCNRKKVVTDEEGNFIESTDDSGIFSEFRGYMIVEPNTDLPNPRTQDRVGTIKLKIPQSFDYNNKENGNENNVKQWIAQHSIFKNNKIYSVACNIPVKNESSDDFNNQSGLILGVNSNISNRLVNLGYDYRIDNNVDGDGVRPNNFTETPQSSDPATVIVNSNAAFYNLVFICIDQLIYNSRDFTILNRNNSEINSYNTYLRGLLNDGSLYYGIYLDSLNRFYIDNYSTSSNTTLNNFKNLFIQYRNIGREHKRLQLPDAKNSYSTGTQEEIIIKRTAYYYGYQMQDVTTNPITNNILINQPPITFFIEPI
jgi:hypothetical protein